METKVLKPSNATYELAKKIILSGENVAFPTETVYGLGANALDDNAVEKIFVKKGRDQDNPLIVHLAYKKDITKVAIIHSPIERLLIKKCMPGPISIVFDKIPNICGRATCNIGTVAVRIPENKVARQFIAHTGVPICAPSANLSKRPSPTTASTVYEDMAGKIKLIIDGGKCDIGVESTVVRVQDNKIYILRPGKFSARALRKLTGAEVIERVTAGKVTISPGTKYAHYCPKCEMIMVEHNIINNVKAQYDNACELGRNPIILSKTSNMTLYDNRNVCDLGDTNEVACERLFSTLREVEKKYDLIIAEYISSGDMSEALYNRMSKSSSGKII